MADGIVVLHLYVKTKIYGKSKVLFVVQSTDLFLFAFFCRF